MLSRTALRPRVWLVEWGPVAGWAALILVLGGDSFSSRQTQSWLSMFFPRIPPQGLFVIDAILRKTAHLVEYAVLGALAWRAFDRTWPSRGRSAAMVCAVALAVAVAVIDEGGQAASHRRTGSSRDVLVDGLGGAIGAAWLRRRGDVGTLPTPGCRSS